MADLKARLNRRRSGIGGGADAEVCCSILQYVAVCCSMLQCAAVFYSVLQFTAAALALVVALRLKCFAVCCSLKQIVAVCFSVLQCEFWQRGADAQFACNSISLCVTVPTWQCDLTEFVCVT